MRWGEPEGGGRRGEESGPREQVLTLARGSSFANRDGAHTRPFGNLTANAVPAATEGLVNARKTKEKTGYITAQEKLTTDVMWALGHLCIPFKLFIQSSILASPEAYYSFFLELQRYKARC